MVAVSVRPPATLRTPIIVAVYRHRWMIALLALRLPPNTSFSPHSTKKEEKRRLQSVCKKNN